MRSPILVGAILFVTSGCDQTAEVQVLASRVAALESQINELRAGAQATELEGLKGRIAELQGAALQYATASFKPGEDTLYQRVDTVLGPLLLILDDIQPLADGSRVKVRVGNLSAASMVNPKMQVSWHEKAPQFDSEAAGDELVKQGDAVNAWIQGGHTKEVEVMKVLRAGTWTIVTLNLPGVPPDRLEYVDLRVTTNQVSLPMNQ